MIVLTILVAHNIAERELLLCGVSAFQFIHALCSAPRAERSLEIG